MPRILIIDDEEGIRDILGVYCEMLGHEPILVADASACRSFHPENKECTRDNPCCDVLMIDQNLPEMKGLDLIQQQVLKGCVTPVHRKVVISSHLSSEEFMQAKKLGCHVLQKPIKFEIFENWVSGLGLEEVQDVEAG